MPGIVFGSLVVDRGNANQCPYTGKPFSASLNELRRKFKRATWSFMDTTQVFDMIKIHSVDDMTIKKAVYKTILVKSRIRIIVIN